MAPVNDVVVRAWLPHNPEDISGISRIVLWVKVRYTYRARISTGAGRLLEAEDRRCRWLWNQCVELDREARRVAREMGGKPAYLPGGELDRILTGWRAQHDWLREGSVVAQQQTVRDFCKARRGGIKIRARGGRRGHPRFKSRRRARPSLNYTLRGFSLKDGQLRLAGGISVRVVWSRELPSAPSSVRVSRDALGRWWCSFVVQRPVEPLPQTGRAIGLDWGVKAVATTTDPAYDLPHSQHGQKAARALARYQRQMARRKPKPGQPASHGYRHAKRRTAALHFKVAEQRRDEARKWAHKLVTDHDQVAVEDFRPRFLAQSRMARKAADGRIAAAKNALCDAAKRHGRQLVLVPPAYSTMTCSSCGARAKHRLPLSQRTYVCEHCGHTQDRDRNAANVMLARAGFNPAGADRIRREEPRVPLAA
ncbi:MAG: transposase [Actinomycetota bacterium]|nr:transposase [Actinomycetota bacterium]